MKKNRILKYILLFICLLIFNIFRELDIDTLWNYGFIHSIYNGLVPYKDFNMVLTPLSSIILSIPLYVFKSNILIFYIENSVLFLLIYYFMEKLLGKKTNIIFLIFFFFYFLLGRTYNNFLLLWFLVLIYLELNYKNKNYLIGFIIGLSILSKQSIGVFFIIPSFYYCFINKDFKMIRDRIIGCLIPCFIFLFYLIFTGSLYNFFDLCLFGLFDFSKHNYVGTKLFLILFIILFIINILLIIKSKNKIFPLYTLMFSSIAIPIFDYYHVFMYILSFFILVLSYVEEKKIKINLDLFFYIVLVILTISFVYNRTDFKFDKYPNKLKYFNYAYIEKKYVDFSNNLINKINHYKKKNKNIIFLSENSYFYKIILDEDINYYDLINYGNWGYNGSSKLYKKLLKEKNGIFIVDHGSFINDMQGDKVILKFVKKHGNLIEEVGDFKIYSYKE